MADPVQEKIEELIKAAADPKDRAMLMILNKIASNLDVNTNLTRSLTTQVEEHIKRFDVHEKREDKFLNQGRGTIRAMALTVVLIQGGVAWWIAEKVSQINSLETRMDVAENRLTKVEVQHETEARKK